MPTEREVKLKDVASFKKWKFVRRKTMFDKLLCECKKA